MLGAHTVVAPCGRGRGAVRLARGQRGHARPMVAGAERIIPASEPPAVAPGVWERRVLEFADRLNPCVARTVRVLSAPRPGDPIRVHQRGRRRQPASGAVRRSRCRNVDGEHPPTHAGAAGGFRRDARSAPALHVNRVELSFTHHCVVYSSPCGGGLMPLLSRTWCKTGGPLPFADYHGLNGQ